MVEQQVSVPSAQAIWRRCLESVDCRSPELVASLGVEGLRALGLSTPKARYVSLAAAAVAAGAIDLAGLSRLPDDEAIAALVAIKGVGPWTASIYLLFCEGRADIWPPNDVALKHAYGAAAGASVEQRSLDEKAAADWGPWRGVAAHVLWTYYAHLKGRSPI
ncbi:MAG: DNA-3-methyladenine glycosylase family protein [Parvularculaceae bacterium]